MQTRTFIRPPPSAPHASVLRIEQGRGTDDRHRCRVLLAEVLDREPAANLRVLRGEEAHQDRLADRWAGPGARDVGAASMSIDHPLALRGQTRMGRTGRA